MLVNDPLCGLTTGGREECWWSCEISKLEQYGRSQFLHFVNNPTCLESCYPEIHCLSSVLAEFRSAGGICPGSRADVQYPGLFQVSNRSCEMYKPEDWPPESQPKGYEIKKGFCSERTKALLSDQENCVRPIWSLKQSIFVSVDLLIESLCDYDYSRLFAPLPFSHSRSYSNSFEHLKEIRRLNFNDTLQQTQQDSWTRDDSRLTPIGYPEEFSGVTIFRDSIQPENTKHRYPWICSLRSVGQQSSHICGVTLLSRPPGPTVLVTSAHCVYICKSEEGRLVPNCCCPNVGPGLCTETEDCGTNATTVEMTGAEAEVICGEWDTATDTDEEYNVILPIEKITVHPSFDISRGEENS